MIRELLAEHRWSRAGLTVALERFDSELVDGALASLVVAGAAVFDGQEVRASPCLRHVDVLGLLASAAANGHSPPKAPDAATMDRILAASRRREGQPE